MKMTQMMGLTFGAVALGLFGLFAMGYAAGQGGPRNPAYASSIQVKDQDREERGERHEERGEAARLAGLAKIDVTQAIAAALTKVPGTVLKAGLDNENGNLVYSVEINAGMNEIKEVKVDAGNAAILHVDVDADDEEEDE